MVSYLLTLQTFSPLLGVLILLFIPKNKANLIRGVGIASTLVTLVLALTVFGLYQQSEGHMQMINQVQWFSIPLGNAALTIAYELGVDGLSMPLLMLTSIIATAVAIASVMIKKRWKEYFILLLILQMGLLGLYLALNLFLFFFFLEIALVALFFMISIWGKEEREAAAFQFLLYNGVGSAILLIAFLALVLPLGFVTGELTFNMARIGELMRQSEGIYPPVYVEAVWLAIFVGFAVKLPIMPLHTWVLKVYKHAAVPVVMMETALMLKIGAYGLFRLGVAMMPAIAREMAVLLAVLGLINLLGGALLALVQRDLRMVLAYSSISHMGIVLLGLAAMNETGLHGAVFQMVSHGLIAALMFLVIGVIEVRTGTTNLKELGGLAKPMPFISGFFLASALASLGLPGLSGFVSEFLAYLGLFQKMPVMAAIGALGLVLTAAYVLRATLSATFGQVPAAFAGLEEARVYEAVPMVILLALVILIGVYPSVLQAPIQETLVNIVERIGG